MRRFSAVVVTILFFLLRPVMSSAMWQPNGAPVCTAAYDQWSPDIAYVGGGEVIIVWPDTRVDGIYGDIFAQRIDANGAAKWASGGVAVCTATGSQWGGVIVATGAGGAYIAWGDERSGKLQVYAQRLSALGVAQWTADGVSLSSGTGDKGYVSIVPDGSGGIVVGWTDEGSGEVYAQRVNGMGTPQWTSGGELIVTGHASFLIAVATSAGSVFAWRDYRSATDFELYAQLVDATGTPQWTADGVAVCTPGVDVYLPRGVADGSGGAILTWYDGRSGSGNDIYAQRVNASGSPQWTTDGVAVCSAGGSQWKPCIVSDGSGGAVIAWYDRRNLSDYNIYAQRVNPSGTTQWTLQGVPLSTAVSDQYDPVAVADGLGTTIVAWLDTRNGDKDIYAQQVDASGNPQWTIGGKPMCRAYDDQIEPAIASDGAGGAIAAWEDGRNGDADVYATRVDSSGVLTDVGVTRTPSAPVLVRNYPNPFSETTMIEVDAPAAETLEIGVFDASGRKVREIHMAGDERDFQLYAFDGRDDRGRRLPSGVYFCRVTTISGTFNGKMVIAR